MNRGFEVLILIACLMPMVSSKFVRLVFGMCLSVWVWCLAILYDLCWVVYRGVALMWCQPWNLSLARVLQLLTWIWFSCYYYFVIKIVHIVPKFLPFMMLSFSLWSWCAKGLVLPYPRMIGSRSCGESRRLGIGVCRLNCLLLNYGRW